MTQQLSWHNPPVPISLSGDLVLLDPLAEEDAADLADAVWEGELWNLWYTSIPTPERMLAEIQRRLALRDAGTMVPYTVRQRSRVVLDGEIVAGDGSVASFADLMAGAGRDASAIPVSYVVFDILALDGKATTQLPMEERKKILARVVRDTSSVVKIRSFDDAAALFALADELGMEGIVLQAAGSRYYPGQRSGPRCWVKVKTRHARGADDSWPSRRAAP